MGASRGSNVAIIGSGITGVSIAIELAGRGYEVVLVDAERPGSGASAAANGALTPYSDHSFSQALTNLSATSFDRYPDHLAQLHDLTGLCVDNDIDGVLELFIGEEELEAGRSSFHEMTSRQWPVRWLSADAVRELEPQASRAVDAAILYERESRIDVAQLMTASVEAAVATGCHFRYPFRVTSIEPRANGQVRIHAENEYLEADQAVLCTGASACAVQGFPDLPMRRVRGEILQVLGSPGFISRCIYRGDAFTTPRRDGRLLLGTTYAPFEMGMNEDPESVSVDGAMAILSATRSNLPGIVEFELGRVWKGWRPFTGDGMPAVGPYPGTGVISAMGLGGLGFTLAPAVASMVGAFCDGERQPAQWTPEFDPMRFMAR